MFEATESCPNPINTTFGIACVCTLESNCATYPTLPSQTEALIVTSGLDEGIFKHEYVNLFGSKEEESIETMEKDATIAKMNITINEPTAGANNNIFQEILGFGAAITDASAYMLTEALHPDLMDQVLQQAYSHFTFARVPMNSADFSRMNYAMAHELDLSDFCLRDDRIPDGQPLEECSSQDYKLDVLEYIVKNIQPDLKLYVSSWSAPPSFKTQNFTCQQFSGVIECSPDPSAVAQVDCIRSVAEPCEGQPLGVPCNTNPPHNYSEGFPLVPGLDPRYNPDNIPSKNANGNCYHTGFIREDAYESWAGMYAKFVEAYAARGVSMWGVTSQNEPFTQTGLWGSNFWTTEGLSFFVKNHLAPAIRKVQPDIKIMMYDDQLINLTNAAADMALLTDGVSDGIAFHWYNSLESVFENTTAAPPLPGVGLNLVGGGLDVRTVHDMFNGTKFMLMSESCSGYLLGSQYAGPRHGSFAFAYNTAHDMLWDFRNRAAGYVYWNLILDSMGGPNMAGNYVDSPFYVENSTAFVMNPSFFYMSHFSRYVPPGSIVVDADVSCGATLEEYCQFVAFKMPPPRNSDIVVVITNDEVTTDIVSPLPLPPLAKGEGSSIDWTISCGTTRVSGTIPWKSIQTIVLPCSSSITSETPSETPSDNEPTNTPIDPSQGPSEMPSTPPASPTGSPTSTAAFSHEQGNLQLLLTALMLPLIL